MITDYDSMVTAIESWLNRNGLAKLQAEIPNFIAFGQRRIQLECNIRALEDFEAAFTISAQSMALPTDFLRVRSIELIVSQGTIPLEGAPLTSVLTYNIPDRPQQFAIRGTNIIFGPTPDQTWTAVFDYYKSLPILSTTNTTNWFTDNYPELLLAASLYEALLWLKDDVRAQVWETQYNRLKTTLENSDNLADMPYGATAGARLA